MLKFKKNSGFTLIELSIVLVVIGLVTGSILVGQHMIRGFEMRKVHADFQKYTTAVNTFKTKYGCLPGDCENAEDLFGSDPNGCWPPEGSPPSNYTCNGDGDGRMASGYEFLEAWRQLAEAGLIEGVYSGVVADQAHSPPVLPGYNCPSFAGGRFCWMWMDGARSSVFAGLDGNYGITVLGQWPGTSSVVLTPVPLAGLFSFISDANAFTISYVSQLGLFTPSEALQYDMKFDDGLPMRGNIMVEEGFVMAPGCVTPDSPANVDSQYDKSVSTLSCAFFYRTGF